MGTIQSIEQLYRKNSEWENDMQLQYLNFDIKLLTINIKLLYQGLLEFLHTVYRIYVHDFLPRNP